MLLCGGREKGVYNTNRDSQICRGHRETLRVVRRAEIANLRSMRVTQRAPVSRAPAGWRRASVLRLPGKDPPAAVALLAATGMTLPLYRISTTRSPVRSK